MHPFLQNKFIRVAGVGLLIVITLSIVLVLLASMNSARSTGLGYDSSFESSYMPSISKSYPAADSLMANREMGYETDYYPPQPNTGSYTADLESYETTSYSVTARTRQFDEVCSAIKTLKSDSEIHFKSLNESTNNCSSTFYVEENESERVLATLTSFKGVEYVRNTNSVTRHRQQIQSQTSIIQQQLSSVQRSLTTAETQLRNLTDFYLTSDDVSSLSKRVNESLALIDQLTQRKINLTSQLSNLYQQAADLEGRIDVVEFSVNISRSNPIYLEKDSRKWERAWEGLSDAHTDTLIGLSAFFGIFLLWIFRMVIYGLVLLLIAKLLWKGMKFIWNK